MHEDDPETELDRVIEANIEKQIDAFTDDCSADDPYLEKLADLAANAEDKPVFRGRRKRVQVAGIPA